MAPGLNLPERRRGRFGAREPRETTIATIRAQLAANIHPNATQLLTDAAFSAQNVG
jgi:hypothetical protein